MKKFSTILFLIAMIYQAMQMYKVVNMTGKLETITLLYLLLATVMFFYFYYSKKAC